LQPSLPQQNMAQPGTQKSLSMPGHIVPPPQPAPAQRYTAPQEERRIPITPQRAVPVQAPETPVPSGVSTGSQPSYGFVNFEPLPIEPVQPKQPTSPVTNPASPGLALPPDPGKKTQEAVPTAEKAFQPGPLQSGNDPQQRVSGHTVVYPPKQRPARTQIDERDYSVYHIDSSQQSFPKSPSSNDAVQMDDTDIRMDKKLNSPPSKQQKGFLSKFFNRDE
jgi:hypothetical protein